MLSSVLAVKRIEKVNVDRINDTQKKNGFAKPRSGRYLIPNLNYLNHRNTPFLLR